LSFARLKSDLHSTSRIISLRIDEIGHDSEVVVNIK
jgi:hypothetical protein